MNDEKELEIMQFELEISRLSTAKQEMLYKIKEREMDIARIKTHIGLQDKRIDEVKEIIKKLQNNI